MTIWKNAIFVGAIAIAGTAEAQEMDWGPIMQTEAMNSAVDEAAREGSGARRTVRNQSQVRGSNPKTRANCAKVRTWIAEGLQDSRLPRLAATCRQLGY